MKFSRQTRAANPLAGLRRRAGDLSVGRKIGLAAGTMIPLAGILAALGLHSTAYLENSRADVEGQARTDGLTGFLNRRTTENELRALAALGASFGATDSTAAGTVEDLLRLADVALLDAKAQGRGRVVVAESRGAARREGSSGPTAIVLGSEQ